MEGGASSLARSWSSAILAARPCPSLFLLLLRPSVLLTSSFHTRRLTLSASPFRSPSPFARTRRFFPILDCLSSDCTLAPPSKEAFSRLPELATAPGTESRSLAESAGRAAAEKISTQETLDASQQAEVPLGSQKVSRKRKRPCAELNDNGRSMAATVSGLKKISAALLETETEGAEKSLQPEKVSRRKKKGAELLENSTANAHTESQEPQKVSRRRKKNAELNENVFTESLALHKVSRRKVIQRTSAIVETDLLSLEKSDSLSLEKFQLVESKQKSDASLEPGLLLADNTALSVNGSQKKSRRNKVHLEPKENTSANAGTDVSCVDKPLLILELLSRTEMQYVEAKNKQAAGLETDLSLVDNLKALGSQKATRRKKIREELKETASASPETDLPCADKTLQSSKNNTASSFEKAPKVARGKKRHSEELKTDGKTDGLSAEKALVSSENLSGTKLQGADANRNGMQLYLTSGENTSLSSEKMYAKREVYSQREEKLIASLTLSAAPNLTSSDETESVIVTSSNPSHFSAIQTKTKSPRIKKGTPSSFPEKQTTLSNAPVTNMPTSSAKIEIQLPEKRVFTKLSEHASGTVLETILHTTPERMKDGNLELSSLEEVRAVENSVEKASLMEGFSTSNFSDRLSLPGQRPPSHVKGMTKSFPLMDSTTSMDAKASISSRSFTDREEGISWKPADSSTSMGAQALMSSTSSNVGEEGISQKPRKPENMSKADSKSNRKHVWKKATSSNSANTGRTEPASSLDYITSNVSQVMKEKKRFSGGACFEEDISITKKVMPSSETTFIPPSRERAVPKNEAISLQVTGLRKRNSVNSAEKNASLSVTKAFSSMSTPDSRLKSTQSQHAAVTDGKLPANKKRDGGKIETAPKKMAIRNVKANQASTISYVQILGTGFDTGDTVPTVLLFFDRRRFIFNAGEGLHRFCLEHKIKLSKIDHIFLTRVCSETTGGLPGLFLTLAGMGENGMTAQVWGPSTLQDLVNAMRNFVPSASMVHTHCFGSKEDHSSAALLGLSPPILLVEDELVKISAVLLQPSSCSRETVENQKDVGSDDQISQRWVFSESDNNQIIAQKGKSQNNVSVAYICELSEVAGKFDPVKALSKGLKPGFKYGKLQRGESVLSDDGLNMVNPEDVLGPFSRGPVMILVDCPSLSHIPALISATSIQSFFKGAGKVVDCMVHITPASVTKNQEYQKWMRNFSESNHIMAGRKMEGLGMPVLRSSAKILSKLNLVCPEVFPIVRPSEQSHEETTDYEKERIGRILIADNLLKFHFRPLSATGPDRSDVPEAFDFIATQKHMMREYSEISEARDYVAHVWKEGDVGNAMSSQANGGLGEGTDLQDLPECLQHVTREEMEVVFLGTGSSQPSAYRNVSAIYLHLFERGGVLLDCGEGTYAQLKRRYGAKGADDVLMGLKCIWISHMHADHHTGLARILSVRRQLMEGKSIRKNILVVGPGQLKRFLRAYEKIEDLDMDFLDCNQTTSEAKDFSANAMSVSEQIDERAYNKVASSDLNMRQRGLIRVPEEAGSNGSRKGQMQNLWKQPGLYFRQEVDVAGREKLQSVLSCLGLKDLVSVRVVHCLSAFGVVLEAKGKQLHGGKTQSGWKLAYSGDTRPCQELIEASRGATLLIHEATFDDTMQMEAIMKNHSLTKEAIDVGVSAEVYRIFLTHFSQRYPKIPIFDGSCTERTCIAFDMMSVNLADLALFPKLLPALKLLFNDELMTEDDVEHVLM